MWQTSDNNGLYLKRLDAVSETEEDNYVAWNNKDQRDATLAGSREQVACKTFPFLPKKEYHV